MNIIKAYIAIILVIIQGTSYGQSKLPSCERVVSVVNWTNCVGISIWTGGAKYIGEFKDGLANGLGTLTYINGNKYKGEFYNNKINGFGVFEFASGIKYTGEFKDNEAHGHGTLIDAQQNIYIGSFKDSKKNGHGTLNFSNGSKYVGEYKDNEENGRGTYVDISKYQYIGDFKNGKKHGQGEVTFPNGLKCIAEFKVNKMNGNGTCIYLNGDMYEGVFKDDLLSNEFIYVKSGTGEYEYRGEHLDKKRNGKGVWTSSDGQKYAGEYIDNKYEGQGAFKFPDGKVWIGEWADNKANGQFVKLKQDGSIKESGIYKNGILVKSEYITISSFTSISSLLKEAGLNNFQITEEQRKNIYIEQERIRVAKENLKIDKDEQHIDQKKHSRRIMINASVTQPDTDGIVAIHIETNVDTSSLKINGEELGGKPDGNYSVKRVARVGQETQFTIAGIDVNGNTDSKTLTVVRHAVDSKAVFGQLNAANVKQQPAKDAVAIIIGIEKYKRVAKADFANADAQDFYDYAVRALGIKPENIKLLVDEGADDVEIYKAFQNWLPVKVKKGKTDVYVFYSGHGYPGQDGNSLYILPFGADKDLISKTAINQQEIVNAIQSAQPRNVTMFLDSCYSGQTRAGDVLIAGARPIAPKISSNSYPPNFTVISASSNDQISSASPDLKHGIFSYFLMKGMEGDADQNKDGKTTIAEMQEYLTDMVGRQAMGMNRKQQPQLFGDPNKVLLTR
jgi:hypothetical protein